MRAQIALHGWNFATASWVTGVMRLAAKKTLDDPDLPELKTSDQAAHTKDWVRAFEAAVKASRNGSSDAKRPSMFAFLLSAVRDLWVISGAMMLLAVVAAVSTPLVLQQVIDLAGFRAAVPDQVWDSVPIPDFPGFKLVTKNAYVLAVVILILKVANTVFNRLHDTIVRRTAFNIRTVLIAGVSRKALRARPDPRFSVGYVLNLINADSESIALAAEQVHLTWSLLLQIFSAVALLSVMLGSSVGAGVAALLASFGVLGVTVPLFIVSSLPKMVKESDTRVKIIRESLSVSFVVVGQFANLASVVAAFTLYAVRGNAFEPSIIFPSASLFSLLVMPLIQLPQVLNMIISGAVSWNRIYDYLSSEDRENVPNGKAITKGNAVLFENASLSWQFTPEKAFPNDKNERKIPKDESNEAAILEYPRNVLKDLSISIGQGQFIAVVGNVGSGKSSLLGAILGEVAVDGRIAYCPQQAWIRSGTVEENILFGSDLRQGALDVAIRSCHLDSDLKRLPNGIHTILGEKGTSVSGGQKTRIALARAVYSDADIYLFDDPLSSLDAKVSRAVFNDCFKSALKGKTIVLATHNHDILDQTDSIIFLSETGEIFQGTYRELEKISEFSDFVTAIDKQKVVSKLADVNMPVLTVGDEGQQTTGDGIIATENMEIGSVKLSTIKSYLRASGGSMNFIALAVSINLTIHDMIMRSTLAFHESAIAGVLKAPVWWFESQQIGRIMNRFTKDVAAIDQRMLPQIFQMVAAIGGLGSVIAILAINAPYVLIGIIPLGTLYSYALYLYRSAMRQLKRLESVQRSPLYSHVSESLEGISSIRAYNKFYHFSAVTNDLIDFANRPMFYKFGAEIWITLRLEVLSGILLFVISALATQNSVISADKIGVILVYVNTLTSTMNLLLQSAANIETEMVCVERLVEYGENLPEESPRKLPSDPAPGEWPQSGAIEFANVNAFYHSAPEKSILKDFSVKFAAGERVCVVGRTGSGKSTLIGVLLRFVAKTGSVTIDNKEIETTGFETLRSAMEVIPQDTHIFSGSLRSTLDQNSEFSDDQLWAALDAVGLRRFVADLSEKLETVIENGGSNFSLGQRQLLCFARVLLLKPKIVLMDEATSSVDPDTERTLRQVIRQQFVGTTVVAVLHRLQESMLDDFDRVLVIDGGRVAEFGAPRELLATAGSAFAGLYAATSGSGEIADTHSKSPVQNHGGTDGTDDWTVPASVKENRYFVEVTTSLPEALLELDRRMRELGDYHLISRKRPRPFGGRTIETGEIGVWNRNGRPVIAIQAGNYWNFSIRHSWHGKSSITSPLDALGLTTVLVGQSEAGESTPMRKKDFYLQTQAVVMDPSNKIFVIRNSGFAAYGAQGKFKVIEIVDTLNLGDNHAVYEKLPNGQNGPVLGWKRDVKIQVGYSQITVATFFLVPANNVLVLQRGNELVLLKAGQHVITNPNTSFRGFYSLGERQTTFKTQPAYTVEGVPVILNVNLRYRISDPILLTANYNDAFQALGNPAQTAVNSVVSRLSYQQFMRAQKVGGDVPDHHVQPWLDSFKANCLIDLSQQAISYGITVESFDVLDRELEGNLGKDLEKQSEQ
ncbi:ABC transporter C member 13, partial [Entophlyctis luteolus]